ncbi:MULTISPECIES: MltR family transcriptional regulator [unclassified Phenylobacterium]|uniref:MltR family transcriptional regulator n=1 Tax=unclassified Phenylobacterium TaxID=2640670 RepID=UPI00083A50FA|nr:MULTISPECIES: MltR family transcriptional regulator [unclassified Phenylobacterium]
MAHGEARDTPILVTPFGVWAYRSENQLEILKAFETDTDRAVAIVSASMIERALEDALVVRLRQDATIIDRMFQVSGPLGSFSSKIDLAYLTGMIGREAHQDLIRIKNVRNRFAHDTEIKDFESAPIRQEMTGFQLINSVVAEDHGGPNAFVCALLPPPDRASQSRTSPRDGMFPETAG